jgi:hypothetical protein
MVTLAELILVGIDRVFWTGVFFAANVFASLKSGVAGLFMLSLGSSIRLFFLILPEPKQPMKVPEVI